MAQDIRVTLTLDNKQFKRAVKQSQNTVKDFENSSSRSFGLIKSAFVAIGGAAVLRSIIQVGSRFQDLQSSLDVVTGSAQAGADAFQRINDLALTTQFGVEELTQGFIQLKGAGVDPAALGFDSLEDLLFSFSNSASVTTDQLRTFQALLDATSRTVAGGLNLEDLIRIQDSGIPVFTVFNRVLGLSRDQITEVGRSADGAALLLNVLNASSDALFRGALENRLTNTSTLFSNLIISMKNTASALFVILQPTIDAVIIKLTTLSLGLFDVATGTKTLDQVIKELVPGVDKLLKVLDDFSVVVLLLTAPPLLRGLVTLVSSLLGSILRLIVPITTVNVKLKGFAKFAALAGGALKTIFAPLNIAIALVASLAFEFLKLDNIEFSFGERLYISLIEVIRDLAKVVAVAAVVGNNIGSSLLDGIIAGFKGENPLIAIGDALAEDAALGAAFADAFADSLLGEDLKNRLEENAQQNIIDPIQDTNKTLEELIAEQQAELEKMLKTAGQTDASADLDELRKKYEADLQAILDSINNTTEEIELTPLQEFNKELDAMLPATDTFAQGLQLLEEKLGNDKTVAGIRDYESGLRALKDAFNINDEINAFMDSLEEIETLQDFNDKLAILNGLLNAGKISGQQYQEMLDALNDSFEEVADEGLANFLETVGRAQTQLSEDLATALLEGKSVMDSFKNFFKTLITQIIADTLRLMVIQPILSSLFGLSFGAGGSVTGMNFGGSFFGKLFGRERGGPVMKDKPYIVGEKGPELFIPRGASGDIVANGAMGGVTNIYNISAVDTQSFRQALAKDPEYLFNLTQSGARRMPR